MTTIVPFAPSQTSPFQFQATLNGAVYNIIVTWNVFGRFYINVYDLSNNLIVSLPMVGSPSGVSIAAISWANGTVVAQTATPHGFRIGTVVPVTIAGVSPDAYNGTVSVLIISDTELQYAVASYPGAVTAFGSVVYNINLVGGFLAPSSLVFRQQSQQFEIS